MSEMIAQRIADVLEPLIGPVLAKVTVEVEAQRLSKRPAELDYADLPRVSVSLERHLASFVGPAIAQTAASTVRDIAPT